MLEKRYVLWILLHGAETLSLDWLKRSRKEETRAAAMTTPRPLNPQGSAPLTMLGGSEILWPLIIVNNIGCYPSTSSLPYLTLPYLTVLMYHLRDLQSNPIQSSPVESYYFLPLLFPYYSLFYPCPYPLHCIILHKLSFTYSFLLLLS